MHTPAEIGIDDFQAQRSPDGAVPHDAARRARGPGRRAATTTTAASRPSAQVVQHYDSCFGLGLTTREQSDVVEYLKSL